jgi:hypothetical protein
MAFRIGQKVTPIRTTKRWMSVGGPVPTDVPQMGQVLTIVYMDVWAERKYLEFPEWPSAMWEAAYFRPVVERPTSIEIFQRMLSPTPTKERVTG